ncbi:MAG: PLAT/LH2 domain-containing protein [Pyrinomonadaceae bacterium]
MADILKFTVQVKTTDVANAGTNSDVYLGICGREFFLDSPGNDFVRGTTTTYILGEGAFNILDKPLNDPRHPQLRTEDLDRFPVYIRMEPSGDSPDWNLSTVTVEIGGTGYFVNHTKGIWLGRRAGKVCFLKKGKIGE